MGLPGRRRNLNATDTASQPSTNIVRPVVTRSASAPRRVRGAPPETPVLTPRILGALVVGKAAGVASRAFGRGGGTSVPGAAARRIHPGILRDIVARSEVLPVLVTGSNGKTTTSRLTAAALRAAGRDVTTNAAGANLVAGVTATAVSGADLRGRLRPGILLAEVDEGALGTVADEVRPASVVMTGVFRDQLDRFGEIHAVGGALDAVVTRLPRSAAWIANADDPLVASLAPHRRGRRVTFGLELDASTDAISRAADTIRCPRCRSDLAYRAVYLSHLGDYRCTSCGFTRPPLDVAVTRLRIDGIERTEMTVRISTGELELSLPQAGTHIAYDAAAAIATLIGLGVDPAAAPAAFAATPPAFGRLEPIDAAGCRLVLAFVKNPTSYNTTLRTLAGAGEPRHALFALSNTLVDGEDFAWLWDVDLETVVDRLERATLTGSRADEIANRLRYAGLDPARMQVVADPGAALDSAIASTPPGDRLIVLAGYTPTLELRAVMQRRGWVAPYWET